MIEIYDRDLSQAVAHHSRHSADELLNGKAHRNDVAASDAPVTVPRGFVWPVLQPRPKLLYASQISAILAAARSFLNKNSYPSHPGRTVLLPCYNINLQVNTNLASEEIVANVRKTLDTTETLLQN